MVPWQSALIGLIEGLTEFLPVSSTGHIMIASELMGIGEDGADKHFQTTFDVVIQLGAILAVVVLYWRSLLVDRQVMLRVAVAFIPTGILGFLFFKQVKAMLEMVDIVLWSLAIGGVFLILFERFHGERPGARDGVAQIPLWKAACIGVIQSVSMVPGVSRSAATVLGGLALRLNRRTSVEFSFLLAVPTMAAASAYKLYKDGADLKPDHWLLLLIGFAVSFVVALATVHGLLRFVRTHTFAPFGFYRIAAALGFAYLLFWRV
jgi:undecaprenyl-diphosphatase